MDIKENINDQTELKTNRPDDIGGIRVEDILRYLTLKLKKPMLISVMQSTMKI